MKINPGYRTIGSERTRMESVQRQVASKSFADLMQEQETARTQEALQRMLEDIHRQGERLARSMTVRDLMLYRQMVKRFLEDTVRRGVGLKETRGWDRRGRIKRYKLVEEIDAILVSMGEELLKTEEGRLELLAKIGEIRGLLMNLVF
ncbi:MAG: hypothetical protein A9Z00_01245 [Thermobacillus sp. ZCTH02-B1]|uniref:YaaR family protein n=1 Tax=Thermobacillus sp. ZCTH02-B1 TaxID=1858795 RepID=UPI000B55A793|nr:YaaR family protein [Thermobacillus sp. ZCTH02-B1]OUM93939.1 MAG: hypothetical protein A9Z00_01245 [Thermobacillus sp. ZCTH02-B1]